jgi:hypothetical protein
MPFPRHRWSIDAVTAGQGGRLAGLPGRMRQPSRRSVSQIREELSRSRVPAQRMAAGHLD